MQLRNMVSAETAAAVDELAAGRSAGPGLTSFRLVRARGLKIEPRVQIRLNYDPVYIKGLAASIKANRDEGRGIEGTGYEQPINVYHDKETGQEWTLFGGHRTLAGQVEDIWGTEDPYIPAFVSEGMDVKQATISAIIENEDRNPPTPMEQAKSYERLHIDFDMSVGEIAKSRGLSQSAVREILERNDYDDDLKQLLSEKPNSKRLARDIHTKIGRKDNVLREELIQLALGGMAYDPLDKKIKAWQEAQKTAEAVRAAEIASYAERRAEQDKRPSASAAPPRNGITYNRSGGGGHNTKPLSSAVLPRTPYETLFSNLALYVSEAFDVCVSNPPKDAKKKRDYLTTVRESIARLENLERILTAGKSPVDSVPKGDENAD